MLRAGKSEITDTELDSLCTSLPKGLCEKQKSASSEALKRDRALAYIALMYAIYEAGIDPDCASVDFLEQGKPVLRDTDYKISISHAGGVGIAAISLECDLGIDIELIDEKTAATLNKVCGRFIPSFYPHPNPLTDYIYDGEPMNTPEFEVKFYELIPRRYEGKPYLEKSTVHCHTGIEGTKAEKWTCAEALLKLDGRGFAALPHLSTIRESAHLYSAAITPHGKSSILAVSLATK